MGTELPAATLDFAAAEDAPLTVGFITHAKNVEETDPLAYEMLFAQLETLELRLQGLTEVMGAYPRTAADPLLADESGSCVGEADKAEHSHDP